MIRLAADEDFNNNIVRGLLRRKPDLDIVRIQDVGLSGADDPAVLEWCAREGRVLLTHDVSTMTRHAYARIDAGQPMPGVFEVHQTLPIGRVIKISSCWRSVASKANGKARYATCRCKSPSAPSRRRLSRVRRLTLIDTGTNAGAPAPEFEGAHRGL